MRAAAAAAPNVRLRFAAKPEKTPAPLRDGDVDLEIGTIGDFAPEIRSRLLFRDRFVGVVRDGHGLLASEITPERYAAARHVAASRRGDPAGPVDAALTELSLTRVVAAVVPSFADVLRVVAGTDLVGLVPRLAVAQGERFGVRAFALPFETPELAVRALWHPRLDADPGQRWLRSTVFRVVQDAMG